MTGKDGDHEFALIEMVYLFYRGDMTAAEVARVKPASANGIMVEGYDCDANGEVRMYRVEGQIADADRDGDVDIADFESVQRCFSGDGTAIPAGCSAEEIAQLDVDGDDDIDEQDLGQFLDCWQGPAWAIRATGDYDEDGWVTADLAGGVSDVDNFVLCTQKSLPQDPQCDVFDFDGNGNIDLYDYGTLAGLVGYPAGTPWGGCVVAQTESRIGNPYFFTGQRLDLIEQPGMPIMVPAQVYHYRARWYDPVHGRFGQRDPIEYTDSIDLCEYVRSGPSSGVDPYGEIRDEHLRGYYTQPGEPGFDDALIRRTRDAQAALKSAAIAALIEVENNHKSYWYFRLSGLDRALRTLRHHVQTLEEKNFPGSPAAGAVASYRPRFWFGIGGGYFSLPDKIRPATMFHESIHLYHDDVQRFADERTDEGIAYAAEGLLQVIAGFKRVEDSIRGDRYPDALVRSRWKDSIGVWNSVKLVLGISGQSSDWGPIDFSVTRQDVSNVETSLGFHISCQQLAEHYNLQLFSARQMKRSCIHLVCYPDSSDYIPGLETVEPPFDLGIFR